MKQYAKMGGELVTREQYIDRLEVCAKCPSRGEVKIPVPAVVGLRLKVATLPGCTECGCPFATKPQVRSYLSAQGIKTVTCPLGKWEDVDSIYNNSLT